MPGLGAVSSSTLRLCVVCDARSVCLVWIVLADTFSFVSVICGTILVGMWNSLVLYFVLSENMVIYARERMVFISEKEEKEKKQCEQRVNMLYVQFMKAG